MCDTIWCKFALYWGTGTCNFSPSGTGKAASFAPKQTVTTSGGEENWFPHTQLKSFSVFENQYKVKRNFSSFFSHLSSWITSNIFESNKEPHQILLRQPKVSSSTCCSIYLMHKPQKRPRELSIKNESHLYPSSLESLTFGKILSRRKRAQEVLYPLYPRRITSAWTLKEYISAHSFCSRANQARHSKGQVDGEKKDRKNNLNNNNNNNNHHHRLCTVSPLLTSCIPIHITHKTKEGKKDAKEEMGCWDRKER